MDKQEQALIDMTFEAMRALEADFSSDNLRALAAAERALGLYRQRR